MKYHITVNGREHEVVLVERAGELTVEVDGQPAEVSYDEVDSLGQVALVMNGETYAISIESDGSAGHVAVAGKSFKVELEDERERAAHAADRAGGKSGGVVESAMPGVVVEVLVAVGDDVEAGQSLLILEAMKMQNEIAAPAAAKVAAVHVEQGAAVGAGEKLVTLE